MGVLSKASLALDLSGGEHYFVPVQSAAYMRAATWIIPGTSYSDPDGVLPVFEFAESRRRAPAFNAGKQAYDEAFPGGAASPSSSAPGLSHVRGKVLLRVDAGNVGKPTVNASSLTVWLIRREPTSVGVGEPLMKQELWRADDSQGFTDLVGKAEFSFSFPILPTLAASFAELPVVNSGSGGISILKGHAYLVKAVLTRPSMPDVEATQAFLLRSAVPPQLIPHGMVKIHKGTLGRGKPTYKITVPRVVTVSDSATFPVTIRLTSQSASLPSSWNATARITEWFGAVPNSNYKSFARTKPAPGGVPNVSDSVKIKVKPVRAAEEVTGVLTAVGSAADATVPGHSPAPTAVVPEEASVTGTDYRGDGGDEDDAELLAGSETAVVGTVRLPSAGLRADWCDGTLYSSHAVEVTLAPAPKDGGFMSKLVRPKKIVVRVPVRVVNAAEAKPEVYAGWKVAEDWDEWPWKKYTETEGFKPLWEDR